MGTTKRIAAKAGAGASNSDDAPTAVFKLSEIRGVRERRRDYDPRELAARDGETPLLPSAPSAPGARDHAALIVRSGPERGLVVRLDRGEVVIGRDSLSDVWADDPGVSRKHARVAKGPDDSYFIEDLGSTNGTFVGGNVVSVARLSPGDLVQLGMSFQFEFVVATAEEETLRQHLFDSAIRDPLTGIYNRRYFAERLSAEFSRARRTNDELSVCVFDCDHFRAVNNVHGHLAGDCVLVDVVARISAVAATNVVARYGGEEFVVLAPSTSLATAADLAEQVRRNVERATVDVGHGRVAVTVSGGVASIAELGPTDPPLALVGLADQRLFDAKLGGRNRIEAFER